jgi:hypothetical protein
MTQTHTIDSNLRERFEFQLSKPRINFDDMTSYLTYFDGESVLDDEIILMASICGLDDNNINELRLKYGENLFQDNDFRHTTFSVLNEKHLHMFELDDSDDGAVPLIKFKQHINPFYVMKTYQNMVQ